MRGNVDRHAVAVDVARGQHCLETRQRLVRARHDAKPRRIHGGKAEIARHQRLQRIHWHRHGQHAATRHGFEQAAAQVHQAHHVPETHDPRNAGGGVLAHGMAEQGARLHALRHPQPRERHFENGDRRKLDRGRLKGRVRFGARPFVEEPGGADALRRFGRQIAEAFFDPAAEFRL